MTKKDAAMALAERIKKPETTLLSGEENTTAGKRTAALQLAGKIQKADEETTRKTREAERKRTAGYQRLQSHFPLPDEGFAERMDIAVPIGEQTEEQLQSKLDELNRELNPAKLPSPTMRKLILGHEEDKERENETRDAIYQYEAELKRRKKAALEEEAQGMTDEEIDARVKDLKKRMPGPFEPGLIRLGLLSGDENQRSDMKTELDLLRNYKYERTRQSTISDYENKMNEDSAAQSHIAKGMEAQRPAWNASRKERLVYAAVTGNIFPAFGLTGAGTTAASPEEASVAYLSEDERRIVAYYAGKGDIDSACSYLKAIEDELMARRAEDVAKRNYEISAKHPALGTVARLGAGLAKPAGIIGTVSHNLKNEITGEYEPLKESSAWFDANRIAEAAESGVLSNIDSNFGRFLAQNGFSIADNVMNRLVYGNSFALAAMSMEAAGDGAYAAAQSGASPEDALILGIASGGIEYLTEKIPFEHLTDMLHSAGKSGVKQALLEIIKQAGSEALEEATSEYANFIVDAVVRGDESEYNRYIAELVASGMDFTEAEKEAVWQYLVVNPALSAAGGALSGGVMGGGATVLSNIQNNRIGKVNIENREAVSRTLVGLGESAENAARLYDSVYLVANGKGNDSDIKAVAASDAAMAFVREQIRAKARAEKKERTQTEKTLRQQTKTAAAEAAKGNVSSAQAGDVKNTAYGKHGTQLAAKYGSKMQDVSFGEVFGRFYQAGRAGISFEKADAIDPAASVPRQERYRIWSAGQNDVPVSDTGLRGDTFDGWSAEEITTVDRLAHALGVQVVGVESVRAAGADGTWRVARARLVGNTIEVARNTTSTKMVMQVLGHEFTHRLKQLSADDFSRLEAFALSHSQTADEVRAQYASLNLSEQDMAEEITAVYAEMLFSDEQTARHIANEDRGLARRIWDFIKDLIGRIRGKVPSELTQAERLWRNALHSAEKQTEKLHRAADKAADKTTKNTAGGGEEKFSIRAIPGTNNQYVQADRPVMKGDDPRQWAKYVENYLAEKVLEGEELYIRSVEGDMLTINQTTAWKMGDRAKRNRKGEVVEFLGVSDYDAKTNAALHIDEIVKVSKLTRRAPDFNSRHDADHFSYRTAYFMDYDGQYYKLEVSVKEHMGDKTVYNIGNIEKRSSPLNGSSQINGRSGTSRDNADALRRTSTADTISQNEDNVNSHDMQDGVKYSLVGTTEEGIEVYETSEDVKALPYSERKRLFVHWMEEEYRGRTAKFIRNGHAYYATFSDVGKLVYGDKRSDKNGNKARTNVGASGDIFELVEYARYDGSRAEVGKTTDAHRNVDRWDYYVKTVRVDNRLYDILVNVKQAENDRYVYSVQMVENKKAEASPLIEETSSSLNRVLNTSVDTAPPNVESTFKTVHTIPSDSTISQKSDTVNSHDMHFSEKYALAYTTENEPVVVVEEDILAGKEPSEWVKTVKDTIRDKFSGGIPVSGRLIKVTKDTRKEFTYSKYTQNAKRSDNLIYSDKMKSANNLDEIVLASTNYINEDLKHTREDSFKEFARGDVLMRVDGRNYSARVIIGFTSDNEMVLYDVVGFRRDDFKLKNKGISRTVSSNTNNSRQDIPSTDTISQSEDNVNSQSMQNGVKYSLDAMDKTEALLEQYGALPEGEREGSAAGREVKVPRRTAKDNRTRRTVRTVMEAAVTSDEIAGNLKEKIEAGEFSYLPTSNRTLLDNAETLVKEKGFDAVLSEWRAHVESTREANDRMLGVGEYLLIHALKTKDANLAGTLAVELSVEATAAGRSVSAVRMIKRLGPAAKVYEVMRTVEKLSETTIERRGSRKAVEELSEKRNTLMAAYLGHEDAMLDARHEVEALEFLRDNLRASEKSEAKIEELEKEIEQLRGLLEKSKNPAKRRELGERLDTANDDLEKAKELAKKQRQSRGQAIDDLAAIQERIRKAEKSTEQDMRRIEKLIEKLRRRGGQTETTSTKQAQEITAEVSAALAEARERLRAVTAEAGNMHAKYSRILEVDKELHKLGKYTVDSALLDAFLNAKTVKEAEAAGDDILAHVAEQVPSNFIDKWDAWRYLSMLGNLRTHLRNILGNAVFVPAVRMKNLVDVALESIYAKRHDDFVRTKDIRHSVLGVHDEYRTFAESDYAEIEGVLKAGGKYNPSNVVEENRRIFNTKWLEKLRKKSGAWLETEDGWALKPHYVDSLAGYLAANKIDTDAASADVLDAARAYAMEEALKATYRDFSKAASVINKLANTNSFTKIFVNGILPFKKTPINILKRGVEYSPLGLMKTLTKGVHDVKTGKITSAQFLDGIAAGLTGTGLVVVGYLFASLGWIAPGLGDDDEDEFAELQGRQGYALTLGDWSYTIDWMAPAALPIFVGAALQSLFHETGEDSPEVLDVIYDVIDPVFEMSMLQGVENALSAVKNNRDGYAVGDIVFEGVTGYLGQAVPTALGQFSRVIDGTRRRTYTESGAPFASVQRFAQRVMNKTPLSRLNAPYVDEWGREQTTENVAWRIFNNFVSPGYSSTYKTSPMEEELKRLYETTGKNVFPKTASKTFTVDGIRVSMNAKEYTTYQKVLGQTAYHTLTELTELSSYRKAEDALRAGAIDKVYDYAAEMAKKAVLGKDYTPSSLVENIECVTAAGVRVSEYLMFTAAVSEMKSVYGKDGKTVIFSKQDQVEEYLRGLSLRAAQKKALWATLYDSESPWG